MSKISAKVQHQDLSLFFTYNKEMKLIFMTYRSTNAPQIHRKRKLNKLLIWWVNLFSVNTNIFFFFFHTWFFHQRFMLGTSVDLFFYCCFGLVCNYSCKLENLVCTCGFFFFLCLHFWTSFAEFKCSVL